MQKCTVRWPPSPHLGLYQPILLHVVSTREVEKERRTYVTNAIFTPFTSVKKKVDEKSVNSQ